MFITLTLEKGEVSPANILHVNAIQSGRSLIYIRNNRGPNTIPCSVPAKIFCYGKLGHLKQLFVGDHIRSFLIILGYYHLHHTFLKIKTLYQTLTKVLEISVNVSQTSVWGLQLNLLKISCVIDNNYATH